MYTITLRVAAFLSDPKHRRPVFVVLPGVGKQACAAGPTPLVASVGGGSHVSPNHLVLSTRGPRHCISGRTWLIGRSYSCNLAVAASAIHLIRSLSFRLDTVYKDMSDRQADRQINRQKDSRAYR